MFAFKRIVLLAIICLLVASMTFINPSYASIMGQIYVQGDLIWEEETIITPRGISIIARYILSQDDATEHPQAEDFANIQHVSGSYPTNRYNCHTFAWIYGGELEHVDTNPYVLSSPSPLYQSVLSECYTYHQAGATISTLNCAQIEIDDIILYSDLGTQFTGSKPYVHSGVVVQDGTSILIISKWGDGSVFISDLVNNPYYDSQLTTFTIFKHTPDYNMQGSLISYNNFTHTCKCTYCTRVQTAPHDFLYYNHNNSQHWGICTTCNQTIYDYHVASSYTYTAINHSGTCSTCGTSFSEAHDFVYRINRYVCTVCGYSTKNPIYPDEIMEETE